MYFIRINWGRTCKVHLRLEIITWHKGEVLRSLLLYIIRSIRKLGLWVLTDAHVFSDFEYKRRGVLNFACPSVHLDNFYMDFIHIPYLRMYTAYVCIGLYEHSRYATFHSCIKTFDFFREPLHDSHQEPEIYGHISLNKIYDIFMKITVTPLVSNGV